MTCFFRCGNACDHPEPNRSDNGHIQEEIATALQRRAVLKGAAVGSGALVLGGVAGGVLSAPAAAEQELPPGIGTRGLASAAFRPVRPNKRDAFTVAEGFTSSVVIRWGDPVVAGAPRFDPYAQSVAAARKQFGYNNDYVGLLPLRGDRALLVVNHEYTDEVLMFPADTYTDAEIMEIAMSNHGMSVVEVKRGRIPGSWKRVTSLSSAKYNRRFHIDTEFRLVGPAAGDSRLRTTADPSGTVRPRHAEQLCGRHHPVGHRAFRRGELQPVLRRSPATSTLATPTSTPATESTASARAGAQWTRAST